jgi:hypothetical protein
MDNPLFWNVFKANLLVAVCTISFSIVIALGLALWRRRMMKPINPPVEKVKRGPQIMIFGGEVPQPAHCPLCGQGWPLPGPVMDKSVEQPK